MTYHYYGDKNADIVLIQPVGDHDLPEIENEVAEIKKLTSVDFQLIAVKVEDWNRELSPWEAPAVFRLLTVYHIIRNISTSLKVKPF